MARILVIIPTLRTIPLRTLAGLLIQEVRPSKVVIVTGSENLCKYIKSSLSHIPLNMFCYYVKPDVNEHVGVRVGKAINAVLNGENLYYYDYILKIDDDIIILPKCLDQYIKKGVDLVGLGPFMLIKVSPFVKALSGKWPETPADDSYVRAAFIARGFKTDLVVSCAFVVERAKHHNWKYYYYRGVDEYKIGANPFTISRVTLMLIIRRKSLFPIFSLIGYFSALLRCEKRYEFAPIIFRMGLVARLLNLFKNL